jgi:hypothetical protein
MFGIQTTEAKMFSIKSETTIGGQMHIIETFDAALASEVLEAALRRDLYTEADKTNPRRVFVFYVGDMELDALVVEARNNFDNAILNMAVAA